MPPMRSNVIPTAPPWWCRALVSGSIASITSSAALAWCAHREGCGVWAALNSPSHWVFGDKGIDQPDASWRYTGTGQAIHHASSIFWGGVFEAALPPRPRGAVRLAGTAFAAAALAAATDLRLVPWRFSPGFQTRVSASGVRWTYGAFALGLLLGSLLMRSRRSRRRPG